jgi:hypothetical protein
VSEGLAALAAAVGADGGLPAGIVGPPASADGGEPWGERAARGPRAAGNEAEYALLIELVREGYELHYEGGGRVVRTDDADLALLAGDRLYALGLARLAALGDVEAVAELADVIALAAAARAAGDAELAAAVWVAGTTAVGHGSSPDHAAAKDAARRGEPGAAEALRMAARHLVPDRHERAVRHSATDPTG